MITYLRSCQFVVEFSIFNLYIFQPTRRLTKTNVAAASKLRNSVVKCRADQTQPANILRSLRESDVFC